MRQQVNLYQPPQRARMGGLTGATALAVLGVVIGLLGSAWGYAAWSHARERAALAGLQAQELAEQAQVETLRARHPERKPSKALAAEVERLDRQVAQRRRLLAALSGAEVGNTTGFSAHLEGLARQHVEGMWLEDVVLGRGGRTVALSGRAMAPELVPVYVGRLARESPFKGNQFNQLVIRQSHEDPILVEFGVGTPGATLVSRERDPAVAAREGGTAP